MNQSLEDNVAIHVEMKIRHVLPYLIIAADEESDSYFKLDSNASF